MKRNPIFYDDRTGRWCAEMPESGYIRQHYRTEAEARSDWHRANVDLCRRRVQAAGLALAEAEAALRTATKAEALHNAR